MAARPVRSLAFSEAEGKYEEYRGLLSVIATDNALPIEQEPERVTFGQVVRQAAARPEVIDELVATYGKPDPAAPGKQIRLPPDLKPAHCTEAYRCAWEALLLAPPSDEVVFMEQGSTIKRALSRIADPESLPVIELAFQWTCQKGIWAGEGSGTAATQFRLLECLNRFATQESLQTMLRCLALAENASGGKPPKFAGWDLRQWIVRFLKEEDNHGTKEKWRQVLNSFPMETVPVQYRQLLETSK